MHPDGQGHAERFHPSHVVEHFRYKKNSWISLNTVGRNEPMKLRSDSKSIIKIAPSSTVSLEKSDSRLLFNMVLQKALEDDVGIHLSDNDHDCFTNMRFTFDVLLFAFSKEQLQKNVVRCSFQFFVLREN